MNESLSEELLSAYLDGELTGDERVQVEKWLLENPANRRLHDDLVALRREVQALPLRSLDAGFSDRVLNAIRSRTEPAGSDEADKPTLIHKNNMGMPAWRWFAAGVAATLAAVLLGINFAPETLTAIGFLPRVETAEKTISLEVETASPKTEIDQGMAASDLSRDKAAESYPEEMRDEEDQFGNRSQVADTDLADRNDRSSKKPNSESLAAGDRAGGKSVPGAATFGAAVSAPQASGAAFRKSAVRAQEKQPRKSLGQLLDDAAAQHGEAVLELSLAVRSSETESADGLAYKSDESTAVPAAPAELAKAEGSEDLKENAEESSASQVAAQGIVEIVGTREEVEQLLTALGHAEVADAYFVAPEPGPTLGTAASRSRKAAAENAADKKLESEGGAPPDAAESKAKDASPPSLPADAAKNVEMKRAPRGGTAGLKPQFAGPAAAQFLRAKDAPQRMRVRLRLILQPDDSSPESIPADATPE